MAKTPQKTTFYDERHKVGRIAPLVTPVTDLITVRRKTSDGNLRSSPAINRFVRFAFAGDATPPPQH
jgi:hypothetical protein